MSDETVKKVDESQPATPEEPQVTPVFRETDDIRSATRKRFQRLWFGGLPEGIYRYEEMSSLDRGFHIPRAKLKTGEEQAAFSSTRLYNEVEDALTRDDQRLLRRIFKEHHDDFGHEEPIDADSLNTIPEILMMAHGPEYVIYHVNYGNGIIFIMKATRHPRLNELMKTEHEGYEDIANDYIVPEWEYIEGDDNHPSISISPYVREAQNLYVMNEYRDHHDGRKIQLGRDSDGEDAVEATPQGGYFRPDEEPKHIPWRRYGYSDDDTDYTGIWGGSRDKQKTDDLFYQIALNNFQCAHQGKRVIYANPRLADYVYSHKDKHVHLTRYRSCEFSAENYQEDKIYKYMYAPYGYKDKYENIDDAIIVQAIHMVFEAEGKGYVYPLNQVIQALVDVLEEVDPTTRSEIIQRLLHEDFPDPTDIPKDVNPDEVKEMTKGRLAKFRQKLSRHYPPQ